MKRTKKKRGAAAVEFGLVLIPLSLILLGIIDYGWAFLQAAQVSNAAREGARAAAVGDDGAAAANFYLNQVFLDGERNVTVTNGADRVTVRVDYTFEPLVDFVPLPDQLTSEVTMRIED
jgi:Flp pilus assembly protein TadG